MNCPKGEVYDSGQCWKPCKQGYRGYGSQCFKDCPVGFTASQNVCLKSILYRGDAVAPGFSPCPESMTDDGANCVNPIVCTYVLNPNKTDWVLQCTGTNTIAITRNQRQTCPSGYKLLNNMCYPSCPTGYTEVGNECARDCPDGFKDVLSSTGLAGANCAPPSVSRTLGSLPTGGLTTITSNPNKTTLISRFLANQSPVASVNQYNTILVRKNWNLGSSWTDFLTWLETFSTANPQTFAFLLVLIILFVAYYFGPSILGILGGFTSFFQGVGSGAGKAVAGAGEAIGDVESAAGSIAKGVGSATGSLLTGTGKLVSAAETSVANVTQGLSNLAAANSLDSYTTALNARANALETQLKAIRDLQNQVSA